MNSFSLIDLINKTEKFNEKIWYDIVNTNVTGLLRILKYFYPSLKKTKGKANPKLLNDLLIKMIN